MIVESKIQAFPLKNTTTEVLEGFPFRLSAPHGVGGATNNDFFFNLSF
jgi:hypothetical protein